MHIYAFGSVCRGEVAKDSDVDLLVLTDEDNGSFTHDAYSVYSYHRINELWAEGNPFAWHLFYESKLIFSDNNNDYLQKIGRPSTYKSYKQDHEKFFELMNRSISKINEGSNSIVFELSNVFLSIRNLAICYTIKHFEKPIFSRHSALLIGERSICIPTNVYNILERARILSTRGIGDNIDDNEVQLVKSHFDDILKWACDIRGSGGENV